MRGWGEGTPSMTSRAQGLSLPTGPHPFGGALAPPSVLLDSSGSQGQGRSPHLLLLPGASLAGSPGCSFHLQFLQIPTWIQVGQSEEGAREAHRDRVLMASLLRRLPTPVPTSVLGQEQRWSRVIGVIFPTLINRNGQGQRSAFPFFLSGVRIRTSRSCGRK